MRKRKKKESSEERSKRLEARAKKRAAKRPQNIHEHTGVSEGYMRSMIRSSLRKTWRSSSRRVHINKVRFPYVGEKRFRWAVKCEMCGKIMGQTEKVKPVRKDGSIGKRPTLAYQVDHVDGNPPLLDIKRDLGEYAYSLLYQDLRILCIDCHSGRTEKQMAEVNAAKKEARESK